MCFKSSDPSTSLIAMNSSGSAGPSIDSVALTTARKPINLDKIDDLANDVGEENEEVQQQGDAD